MHTHILDEIKRHTKIATESKSKNSMANDRKAMERKKEREAGLYVRNYVYLNARMQCK